MLTVALVYKSGGDFTADDVACLATDIPGAMFDPETRKTIAHQVVCLTDRPDDAAGFVDRTVPLAHDWPCWWGKMELFKRPGPLLYLDLDTIITGSLAPLAKAVLALSDDQILMLRGFYRDDPCSGIMGWNADLHWLYRGFANEKSIEWVNQTHGVGAWIDGKTHFAGDQDYIRAAIYRKMSIRLAQDACPGLYSYKVHIQPTGTVPDDARAVIFHGLPRPSEVELGVRR